MTDTHKQPRALLAAFAVLAIVVLVGSVVVLVPEKTLTKASLPSAAATSTRAARVCQGPILARPAGTQTSDADFAGGAPSPQVSMNAVAVDPSSNALYGGTQSSQTNLDPASSDMNGKDASPRLSRVDAQGRAADVDAASSALLNSVYGLDSLDASTMLTASTADETAPVLDASQSHVTGSGDYRGFALARCAQETTSASFAGLTTRAGTFDTLVVSNPGTRASRARVTVYSENGVEPATQGSDIVVGPGETARVPVSTLVDERETVALDVEVRGTALAMSTELVRREGLVPQGTENVQASEPSSSLTWPGVVLREGGSARLALARTARGGEPGDAAQVRSEEVFATARAFDAQGKLVKEWDVKDPGQGATVEIPLDGLNAGTYTISLSARSAVTASLRLSIASGARQGDTVGLPQDFAEYTPSEAIDSASVLALGHGAEGGSLTLNSEHGAHVSVAPIRHDGTIGASTSVDIKAGHSVTVNPDQLGKDPASIAGLLVVSQDGGAYRGAWSQTAAADDGGTLVSTLPLAANAARATGMTVNLEPR